MYCAVFVWSFDGDVWNMMPGACTDEPPVIMFQTSPSKLQTKTAQYTSRLFADAGVYDEVGGIEVARSERRMDFLRRRKEWATSYGLPDPQLLSPAEVTEHLPLVNEEEILGGYYSPTDGRIDGIGALQWYMEYSDAAFYGNTTVEDLEVAGGEIQAVVTDRGRIECDRCVMATNNWGYQTGQLAGIDLPIAPVEHQYVVTEPLPELSEFDSSVGEHTTDRVGPWLMYSWIDRSPGTSRPVVCSPTELSNSDSSGRGSVTTYWCSTGAMGRSSPASWPVWYPSCSSPSRTGRTRCGPDR